MPRPKPGQAKQKPRPLIPIDWNRVDQLLQADCSGEEIAAFIGIGADTLYDRCVTEKGVGWTHYKASKNSHGNALLRAGQFNRALKGSDRMLELLGRERLGQGKDEVKLSPIEDIITERHKNMMLEAENQKLRAELDAYKPKAEPELRGSDTQVQHMGGGGFERQDIF